MNRWTWFERDGSIKNRLESELTKITDKAAETMQKRLTVTEQQYVKLVEAGEVDLIHSTIMAIDSSIYPEKALKHKIYMLLSKLVQEIKAQGVEDINQVKNRVLDELVDKYSEES